MRSALPCCLLVSLALNGVHAATYSVGPTRALTTLDEAFSMLDLEPGDIVELDGDVTYPGGVLMGAADGGAPGNPVVIRGLIVNDNRPHLVGGNNSLEVQADHVVIENLEISGTGDVNTGTFRCYFHHSHDVVLRNAYIHDCPRHGILGADQDSGSLTVEYSELVNAGSLGSRHAIYMATDEVNHPGSVFRLQFSVVRDSRFDDGEIGGNLIKSRAERNEIYYNWLEGGFYHELELIGPDPGGAPAGWSEGLVREDSDIVGNVILHTSSFGSVLRFGGDATGQTYGRYRFVNNTVIRSNGGSATIFRLFDGIGALDAHNNVLWNDGPDALRVIREVEALWASGSTTINGSNNWIKTGSSFMPAGFSGTIQGVDPGFTNYGLLDLRPDPAGDLFDTGGSASPVAGFEIDAPLYPPAFHPPQGGVGEVGVPVPRPQNGIIDIGAFEPPDPGLVFGDGFEASGR